MGTEFCTAFRTTIQPPKLMYLFVQELSFLLNFSKSGSHVEILFGFVPSGNPKYLKGRFLSQHL